MFVPPSLKNKRPKTAGTYFRNRKIFNTISSTTGQSENKNIKSLSNSLMVQNKFKRNTNIDFYKDLINVESGEKSIE